MSRIVDEPYFTHSAYSAFTTGIQVKCPKCHGAGIVTADEDTLAYINEMMDLEGLELHQDGESYPNDYFESLHYDFISRCDGDEWPE